MIDLTRPIRTKDKKVAVTHLTYRYDVCGMLEAEFSNGGTLTCDANELTTYFENIPDPRRPREFLIVSFSTTHRTFEAVQTTGDLSVDSLKLRVIEWPFDAPLPEWPV